MNDKIDVIRESANIVDIISSYIPLTQKGKNYFGICPFHDDKNPSMSVSEDKQIYKCFSCGASGNVFTFVRDYEHVSFLEAVKIVAEACGLTFNAYSKKSIKTNTLEYEIMDFALKFYQNNLNSDLGLKAKSYLSERGIDDKTISDFSLGVALDYNYSLTNLLLNKKYGKDTLIDLGLTSNNHDYFQNRIMFPIHDLNGNVVGFTGRVYDTSNQAKYLNSKENVIFKKGQILFNYHRAKNEIMKKKEIIIVEGNMDAIRMYENGFLNTVALMGTSLTKEQISAIKQTRAKVILMFDNDDAGEIATYNNGNLLIKENINPYIVRLSGEKDPDEYIIKNGACAMQKNIASPISFLDFKLNYLKKNKDLTNTADLVSYIKDIIRNLSDFDDNLTKEITIKKLSEEYGIPYDALSSELKKENKISEVKVTPEKKKKKLSRYDIASSSILYYMMNDNKYINLFKKDLGYFTEKKYRELASEIIYYNEIHKTISLSEFITYIDQKEYLSDTLKEVLNNVFIEELNYNNYKEYINVCEAEETKEKIKKIKNDIAIEMDANKRLELVSKLIELKKDVLNNG